MTNRFYASVTGACLLLLSSAAIGQDEGYPVYGGFALGFSASDEDCDYHGYDCDGNDTSFKFYGGKRFHENLAFEISYQELGKLTDKGLSVTTTAETSGINLSLHGIIPVEHLGYFYGKMGMMAWDTDYVRIDTSTTRSNDSGTDFTFGAGFAFTFAEQYEFRIEFERLNELDDNFTPGGSYITVFSFGGTINFN
jgi:OOP family OmpA-OmpF porin